MEASATSGVKPMSITGRMVRERERLLGMSSEERAWRAQWIKDQHLCPNEPVYVPEYWREVENPIRRLYKAPLDTMYKVLSPMLGHTRAFKVRYWTGKAIMATIFGYAAVYYFKYNANDWTKKGGWRVISSRRVCEPGDPEFPKASDRTKPSDYAARGFNQAPL